MNRRDLIRHSKFLSLVLRHRPQKIGLELDSQGWADVDHLLARMAAHGRKIDLPTLKKVVAENDKQRFIFSADGRRIRANQGHSIKVDLGYDPLKPPEFLFHGTAERFVDSIRDKGLLKRRRHHVHLSQDRETAVKVGQWHGRPVVLIVQAGAMHEAGHQFFLSENHVWLTDHVPPEFLEI